MEKPNSTFCPTPRILNITQDPTLATKIRPAGTRWQLQIIINFTRKQFLPVERHAYLVNKRFIAHTFVSSHSPRVNAASESTVAFSKQQLTSNTCSTSLATL